jgi:serine/threonine protein kinase
MEYVEGDTPATVLRDGPRPERAAKALRQIAEGLSHSCTRIVHRDLKPRTF